MSVVIIFELSDSKHINEIKQLLDTEGYRVRWVSKNGDIINLPKNVVWKKGIEQKQARIDFRKVISNYNSENPSIDLKIQSCLFLPAAPWSFITDIDS